MEHLSKKKKKSVLRSGGGVKKRLLLCWITGVSIQGGSCWLWSSGCYVRSLSSAGCCLQGRTAVQRPLMLLAAGNCTKRWLLRTGKKPCLLSWEMALLSWFDFLLVKRPELAIHNCIHLWISASENWIKVKDLGFFVWGGVGSFLLLSEVLSFTGLKGL